MPRQQPNPRSHFKESLANGDPEALKRRFLALLDACQALATSLVLEEVMELICRGVDKAFGLTSVDIYEYRPESDEVVAVWSVVPGDPRRPPSSSARATPWRSIPTYAGPSSRAG